jgi:hypothetical protein
MRTPEVEEGISKSASSVKQHKVKPLTSFSSVTMKPSRSPTKGQVRIKHHGVVALRVNIPLVPVNCVEQVIFRNSICHNGSCKEE